MRLKKADQEMRRKLLARGYTVEKLEELRASGVFRIPGFPSSHDSVAFAPQWPSAPKLHWIFWPFVIVLAAAILAVDYLKGGRK